MSAYSVRKACNEDLLAVVRLYERSSELEGGRLSERQRAAWERMMATEDLTVCVAERDGEVVGTCCLLSCRTSPMTATPLLLSKPWWSWTRIAGVASPG